MRLGNHNRGCGVYALRGHRQRVCDREQQNRYGDGRPQDGNAETTKTVRP